MNSLQPTVEALGGSFGVLARITVGVAVLAALALGGAFVVRASWIRAKIAALSSPPSADFADADRELPPKGEKPRIVLIGDSRIARWPASAFVDRFEVVNRGVGGETSAQMAQRFLRDAIELKPDVIVI